MYSGANQVVSKDVGVRKNGAKMRATWKYSPTCLKTKLRRRHYELEDHVGQEALNLNLLPKLGLIKKNSSCQFSQLCAKIHLSWILISLCLVGPPRRDKIRYH
jgi:hypothetical protein